MDLDWLGNVLVQHRELACFYNYFVSITPFFFIWAMVELIFKIAMNVVTGHNLLGSKDYRLRRFSE